MSIQCYTSNLNTVSIYIFSYLLCELRFIVLRNSLYCGQITGFYGRPRINGVDDFKTLAFRSFYFIFMKIDQQDYRCSWYPSV
jgi:hypothetical protein